MTTRVGLAVALLVTSTFDAAALPPNYSAAKQGFSLQVQMMNIGGYGRIAFPPYRSTPNPPADSIGVAFPVGQPVEHVYGGGLWIGGVLDTTRGSGSNPPLRLVTTAYEAWSGPYYEFHPGEHPADTLWRVLGRGVPKPPGWDAYWGNSLPYTPVADQNFYCTYTDTAVAVTAHVPLRIKVIQSSHAWNEPAPILIFEYRIINMGQRVIDSLYVAGFVDADVGPITGGIYWQRNYSGYYPSLRTAYTHNPVDSGSTPVGLRLLRVSPQFERLSFQWFSGPQSPTPDAARYALLSSGVIKPDEFPNLSETRFFISVGPFTLRPVTDPNHDTLLIATALISGTSLTTMQQSAIHADSLYRALLTSVGPPEGTIPERFSLYQNYPNPFNPSTAIEFDVPSATHVSLQVYDVLGREVAVLAGEVLSPGRYRRVWDAGGFSSGVYFVRLTAGDFIQTRKPVLMR